MKDKTKESILTNLKTGVKLTSEQQAWIKDKIKMVDQLTKQNAELKTKLNELGSQLSTTELLLSSSLEQIRRSIEFLEES